MTHGPERGKYARIVRKDPPLTTPILSNNTHTNPYAPHFKKVPTVDIEGAITMAEQAIGEGSAN